MNTIRTKIRDVFGKRATLNWSLEEVVEDLNPMLGGWMNYFRFANSAEKFSQIDSYVHEMVEQETSEYWEKLEERLHMEEIQEHWNLNTKR
ncbi:MAG: group II intron maturase-specific domain-containing protein [Candidatus Altiarchaeota archaeon]|nr:group II intron maturase-specific domain-containing protein [Candidatus Altiarchaeota archaeon]